MITKIVAVLTLLGILYGAAAVIDARYFKSSEAQVMKAENKELKKSVDMLSTGITRDAKQNRLWALEDRYKTSDPTKVPDPDKKQEMRQLQMDLPVLQKKLDMLEAK